MDSSFIPVEIVPSKTPFGLDQLRRSYKTSLSAEAAIAAAPAVGTADETFVYMFLMPISTPESAESATRLDLLYMGCIAIGEDDLPILPAAKHDSGSAVQSASSSKADDGRTANPPLTAEFYAPSSTLTYFSFLAPGSSAAADPAADVTVITLTVGDATLSIGSGTVDALLAAFFDVQILETHEASEIVPGKYWSNVSRKTKSLTPFITQLNPGPYMIIRFQGTGYTVGNVVTISAGGESASATVDSVNGTNGIIGYTPGADTFTTAQSNLPATGGSGSGATFDIVIVE